MFFVFAFISNLLSHSVVKNTNDDNDDDGIPSRFTI